MRKAWLWVVFTVACGAGPEVASESARSTSGALVEFGKDWSVTQTGTIAPATSLTFRYDLDRLPKCRAVADGVPAWAVLAYVSFDGRAPQSLELAPLHGVTSGVVETTIPVPVASDVAFWFYASDDHGCVEWDSRYGRNFHFPIEKSPRPTIRFGADWKNTQDGAVGPGTVLIDYDLSRAPCHATNGGNDAFSVTMYTSVDGDTPQAQDMTTPVGARRFEVPRYVSLPQGDHTLSIWFESTDVYGCHAWDSNYGQNFVYSY
jgi:hypothetical protein